MSLGARPPTQIFCKQGNLHARELRVVVLKDAFEVVGGALPERHQDGFRHVQNETREFPELVEVGKNAAHSTDVLRNYTNVIREGPKGDSGVHDHEASKQNVKRQRKEQGAERATLSNTSVSIETLGEHRAKSHSLNVTSVKSFEGVE